MNADLSRVKVHVQDGGIVYEILERYSCNTSRLRCRLCGGYNVVQFQ